VTKLITVKKLRDLLRDIDGSRVVLLSIDEEGNGFNELRSVSRNCVTGNGQIKLEKLTPDLEKLGFTNEDVGKGKPAIILWP